MNESNQNPTVEELWKQVLEAYLGLGELPLFRKMKWYEKLTIYIVPILGVTSLAALCSVLSFDATNRIAILCFEIAIILIFAVHMLAKEPLRIRYLNLDKGVDGVATIYEAFMESLRDRNFTVTKMEFVRNYLDLQNNQEDPIFKSSFSNYASLLLFPALGVYFSKQLTDPVLIAAIMLGALLVPIGFSLIYLLFSRRKNQRRNIYHLLSRGILDGKVDAFFRT